MSMNQKILYLIKSQSYHHYKGWLYDSKCEDLLRETWGEDLCLDFLSFLRARCQDNILAFIPKNIGILSTMVSYIKVLKWTAS